MSQLERLNSNETKIAPRSVWTAVNGSDLSAPTFMVSSKMDGSDPHFDAESIATHNTSWDLETALGIKFEGSKGEHFFRSTLVQTLFYGVFSAWVIWAKGGSIGGFD